MKPITVNLERYESMHGWANRILRLDLSNMRIWAQETAPYLPAYLGARGVAARICWDEYPEPVDPFSGMPYLWDATGETFYGIGPDRIDQQNAFRYDRTNGTDSLGDISFRRLN